ncbi:hypothetical protein ACTQ4E_14430 [Lawsonibacter sp. LCP25S3_G6]|uniref:hypothetical protein n=1 Tax=unclassified Lawsonibacter TaxID=2617946 RepID=UPI003F955F5F
MKLHNRILSLLLAVVLLIGLVPAVTQIAVAEGWTYEIRDFENLRDYAAMSQNVNCEGITFLLMNDITITEENLATLENKPLYFGNHNCYFKGTFDGQGHTISGLTFKTGIVAEVDTALFAHTDGATIKNLTIDNAHLYADLLGGILIGHAKNTRVENVTIQKSDLSVDCADNALTLITDGGVIAGSIIGRAENCTLYNCEVNATRVHTAATGAIQALGGKGLYMGALVGSAEETTIEYCRVINGSSVKNSYDVAVGALGGNSVYAGGITGQIKTKTKIIDSFSTASLYTYCATYVSVGAGNVGYVGGISAAVYGKDCEITRCHYAGNATSKQYNAILVIPIIQKNINVSGISQRYEGGTVTGSYFRPSASPETTMNVMGNSTSTEEYGPKDDTLYADRSFWAGHDYDFTGTVTRSSSYNENHTNKWVMDYELGIPVHGQSVAAGFDFPNAGSVTIGVTDLVNTTVTTDDAYDFAVQGFKPTTTGYMVDLSAAVNANFRFVEWYRIPDVTAFSAPEGHEYFAGLMEGKTPVSSEAVYSKAECVDNDLFLAHMEALVRFHDIAGSAIDKTSGAASDDRSKDWYTFEAPLPAVTPAVRPASETAKLIGWTTDKSSEAGGGYSSITDTELTQLRLNGSFYQTGDPIEKPMDLYPVYADLISNAVTIHEGHEQDNVDDPSRREGVGLTWVTMDENNTATIHVGGVGSTNGSLTPFPEGYRFLGWYTDDGNGNQVRISQEQEYTLKGVDLSQGKHTYTARFEYRVQFWLPQKVSYVLASHDFGFTFSKKINEVYVPYETQLFTSEWESAYINETVYQNAPSAHSDYQWKFGFWTAENIRFDANGKLTVYHQQTHFSDYTVKLLNQERALKYSTTEKVSAPLELSGVWKNPDIYAQRGAYVYTDFPYSATVEQTAVNGDDKRTVSAQLLNGYNFAFWNMYGIATDYAPMNVNYADSQKTTSGTLTFTSPATATWVTNTEVGAAGEGINYTHYYIAHNTADVNFHTAGGALIEHATVSTADFPYLTEDKPVTMTRRYQSPVFGTANNVYSGDGNEMSKDPTNYTSTKAEMGTYATAEEAQADGYLFIGWAEPARMQNYERAYAFDLSNGESAEGKPQYISSTIDKAKAYTLKSDALVEHTMELYPVYVPLGLIRTTTNLSDAQGGSITVPANPTYTTAADPDNSNIRTVTVQADITTTIPGSSEPYKLLRMTVSVDGGEEIDLTTGDVNTGEYTYTPIEPGHSYLFTAYYQPYVVIFHQNGTADMVTQLYNQYDHIRNTPLPTIQDSNSALDDYIFIGWTEQTPENGLYLTYVAEADETVTYDKMDDIYHFVGDGTSVSHAMELWPVYINIRVQVNSNIDAELTEKGVDLNTIRKVDRNAADSLQTKVVATEVEGYKFYGWYKEIPSGSLADDAQYTNERLVSKDSTYHLTGDKPYETTVYTARYIKVYKVIYHDLTGDVLETEYVYENDDHAFVTEQTLTDADGNPIKNEDGSEKKTKVLYNSSPFYAIHEKMTQAQTFDTWVWVKSDGSQTPFADFCEKQIIAGCIEGSAAVGAREMHLYPIVWTLSAKDSTGQPYDKLIVSGSFTSEGNSVKAYFDSETAYSQPSLTVHVEKNKWTDSGSSEAPGSDNQKDVPVTLYPDSNSEAVAIDTKPTDIEGNATFYFNAASLTIEKTGGADLVGQTFLFTVQGTGVKKTVSVTCEASKDSSSASGSVTLLLPAGIYSVTEDLNWAYRSNTPAYQVCYGNVESSDNNASVKVSQIGSAAAKVICTNTQKAGLKGWLWASTHKENLFN